MRIEVALAYFEQSRPTGVDMITYVTQEAAQGNKIALALLKAEAAYTGALTHLEPQDDGA